MPLTCMPLTCAVHASSARCPGVADHTARIIARNHQGCGVRGQQLALQRAGTHIAALCMSLLRRASAQAAYCRQTRFGPGHEGQCVRLRLAVQTCVVCA